MSGALPVTRLYVDGRECTVLVDTGSTDNIIYAPLCAGWRRRLVRVTTISGGELRCSGVGTVTVEAPTGHRASLEVLVVEERPLGVDVVLGVAGISALGGVTVLSPAEVRFCGAVCHAPPPLDIETRDFRVQFDAAERKWSVAWKWSDGVGPQCLTNAVPQYAVPPAARHEFEAELDDWIRRGWLVPYDERRYGAPKGLVPLMAVEQRNRAKVRPVLDYRELNGYVTAHTADSDVCAEQLRKWRRHGANVAVVDLKRAYLQLHLEEELWPFQTVMVRGRRYCLVRLGFGLNVAPLVMKAVVRAVLDQDPDIERAVLPYVDDLLVNEDIVSAERVVAHFAQHGLDCKPPERAASGARLLGLRVQAEGGELRWKRDNDVSAPPECLTRRSVFAWCGRLVAHVPVCGWLRPAVAWLKRRANELTRGWDDVAEDAALREQMDRVASRLASDDPARGVWCVAGDAVVVWADASSLATGVVLETPDGNVIEDACWLRRDDAVHINMAELDAAIRGVNLAVAWGAQRIDLRTDSVTVHRWIDDAISGRARLRTKANSELLIRRRVAIIRQLVDELQLRLTVALVRSADNHADALTRVPREWLRDNSAAASAATVHEPEVMSHVCDECEPSDVSAAAASGLLDVCATSEGAECEARMHEPPTADESVCDGAAVSPPPAGRRESELHESVRASHDRAGHPGVRRTLYFARRDVSRKVTRAVARAVVESCDACRSIDPAPVRWRHGCLSVSVTWQRIAIDVTHYHGQSYLSVIDCGPSRYCVWRLLRRANAAEVVSHLEQLFYERGAPEEILADNDTVFRGRQVAALSARWRISLRFRAVHEPSGNGVVERCHRSVKVIAARRRCSVAEAVHIYNVTPRDGETAGSAPASGVYQYPVRDCIRPALRPATAVVSNDADAGDPPPAVSDGARLKVGDRVWFRRRGSRCTQKSCPGTVTRIVSRQVVEIDGVPWHVRDIRPRSGGAGTESDGGDCDGDRVCFDDEPPMYVACEGRRPESDRGVDATVSVTSGAMPDREVGRVVDEPAPLRRSTRPRKELRCHCCDDQ